MTALENYTTSSDKEFRLGLLLVHGIGTQRPSETLVQWGDALLKTIESATRESVAATIEHAGSSDRSGKGRVEATVLFRTDSADQRETWLLSECWWADAFLAPSYKELVSWSVKALPWSIATHIAERFWQTAPRTLKSDGENEEPPTSEFRSLNWDWRRDMALASVIGQLFVALILTPVLVALVGLSLILGLLPIPKVRSAILAVQSLLTATVGDCFAFVESPLRAAQIRTCITEALEELKTRCNYTVILAHSQGAAVVLDALGGMVFIADDRPKADAHPPMVPDALLTFGAGTNQLASQKKLSAGPPKTKKANPSDSPKFIVDPILGAAVASLGAIAVALWLFVGVMLHWVTLGEIFWALLLAFLGLVGSLITSIALLLYLPELFEKLARGRISNRASDIIFLAIVLSLFFGMTSGARYLISLDPPKDIALYSIFLLLGIFGYIFGSIKFILGNTMKKIATAPVRKPRGLHRWVDLYASADPVPNGPTRTEIPDSIESVQIWNLGSMLSDHTAYWSNRDEFVLRVAKLCAETAKSPWSRALPEEPCFEAGPVDTRAAWRVGLLRTALLVVRWIGVVGGVVVWNQYQASIPMIIDAPSWIPSPPLQLAELVTLVATAILMVSAALSLLWKWWVYAEQEAVLTHDRPGGLRPLFTVILMAIVAGPPIVASYVLFRPIWLAEMDPLRTILRLVAEPLTTADEVVIAASWFLVLWTTLFWRKLTRPPKAPVSPNRESTA